MELRAKITELATNYKAAVKTAISNISKNYAADFQAFKTQVVAKIQARQPLTDADIALAQKLQTTSKAFQGDPLFEAVQAASAQVLAFCEKAAAQLQTKAVKVSEPEMVAASVSKSWDKTYFEKILTSFNADCASGKIRQEPHLFDAYKKRLLEAIAVEKKELESLGSDESLSEQAQVLADAIAEHEKIVEHLSPDACSEPDYYDIEVEDYALKELSGGNGWTAQRRVRKIPRSKKGKPQIFFSKIYQAENNNILPVFLVEGGKNNKISPSAKSPNRCSQAEIEAAIQNKSIDEWVHLRTLTWNTPPLPNELKLSVRFEHQSPTVILNLSEVEADLQKIADELKKDTYLSVILTGNIADENADPKEMANPSNSFKFLMNGRAETIREHLVKKLGVDAEKIQINYDGGKYSRDIQNGRNVTATFRSPFRR